MGNKILVRILIGLVVLLLLGIILFSKIFFKSDEKEESKKNGYEDTPIISITPNDNKYESWEINSYYSYLSVEDRNKIDTEIDEIVEKLNQKKYEELYAMLKKEYKDYLCGNDIEKFKKYIDSEFDSNCYCLNYRITYYGCFLNLAFEGNEDKKLEIQLQNYKADSDEENMLLFFDDIVEIMEITDSFQTPEIVVAQRFLLKYEDKTTVNVSLRNKTSSIQTVDLKNSKLLITKLPDTKVFNTIGNAEITLSSKESKSISIDFDYSNNSAFYPDVVAFSVKVGNTFYQYNLYMKVDEDTGDYESNS